MKSRIILYAFAILFLLTGTLQLNAQNKTLQTGTYSFAAPTAPEEYSSGIIEFKKDTAFMQFTGTSYKMPSNWVKAKGDSIYFESNIDGTLVLFSLKIVDKEKINGDAVWQDGQTVMILKRK